MRRVWHRACKRIFYVQCERDLPTKYRSEGLDDKIFEPNLPPLLRYNPGTSNTPFIRRYQNALPRHSSSFSDTKTNQGIGRKLGFQDRETQRAITFGAPHR